MIQSVPTAFTARFILRCIGWSLRILVADLKDKNVGSEGPRHLFFNFCRLDTHDIRNHRQEISGNLDGRWLLSAIIFKIFGVKLEVRQRRMRNRVVSGEFRREKTAVILQFIIRHSSRIVLLECANKAFGCLFCRLAYCRNPVADHLYVAKHGVYFAWQFIHRWKRIGGCRVHPVGPTSGFPSSVFGEEAVSFPNAGPKFQKHGPYCRGQSAIVKYRCLFPGRLGQFPVFVDLLLCCSVEKPGSDDCQPASHECLVPIDPVVLRPEIVDPIERYSDYDHSGDAPVDTNDYLVLAIRIHTFDTVRRFAFLQAQVAA